MGHIQTIVQCVTLFIQYASKGANVFRHPVQVAWYILMSGNIWITIKLKKCPEKLEISKCSGAVNKSSGTLKKVFSSSYKSSGAVISLPGSSLYTMTPIRFHKTQHYQTTRPTETHALVWEGFVKWAERKLAISFWPNFFEIGHLFVLPKKVRG